MGNLAGALSAKTGIDDEVIQSGSNLLLTFKNIKNEAGAGNDIFNQTTATLVDMAVALGTEPKAAAVQLGKALNDPIKGIAALGRVGVTFTEEQKGVIKSLVDSGNVAGAQKIILKELNSEFGGSAEAAATAGDKFGVAFGNLKEAVGTALLPILDRALTGLTAIVVSLTNNVGPAFTKVKTFIAPFIAALSSAFGGGGGGGFLAGVQSFGAAIQTNFLPVLQTMVTTFTTSILPALRSFVTYLAGSLGPVFATVFGIIRTQVIPILAAFAQFMYSTIFPAIVRIATAVASNLKPVFDQLVATFRSKVLPALQQLLAKFREWQPTIQKVIAVVVKIVGKLLVFAAAILGKVLPPVIRFAGFLLSRLVPAIINTISNFARGVSAVINFGKAVIDGVKVVIRFATAVKEKVSDAVGFIKALPGKASAALGDLGGVLKAKGAALIQGLIDGISSKIDAAVQKVRDGLSKIKNLLPGSPIKEGPLVPWNGGRPGKLLMGMLAKGIVDGTPLVVDASEKAVAKINKKLEKLRDGIEAVRDRIKSALDGLKSDFSSIRDSVASAFTGNLFEATNGGDFVANLMDTKSNLSALKAAFKKLVKFGLPPSFLSQLFASGNGGLILDLAAGSKAEARGAASLFGDVTSLGNSLGTAVAKNDLGPEIRNLGKKLDKVNDRLKDLPERVGREINSAAGNGRRNRSRAA